MSILSDNRISGSLEYWGSCQPRRLDFPKVRTNIKLAESPVRALRDIFGDDPNMRVTKDRDGIIRMVETDVPLDVLKVRIGSISLGKPRFSVGDTPIDALHLILTTPEVQNFEKAHDVGPLYNSEMVILGSADSAPKLPRFPKTLHDVTVSQALDRILKSYPGLWIYENCASKKKARVIDFAIHQDGPAWTIVENSRRKH